MKKKTWKAGGIPYFVNNEGTLRVLLVTSTNPQFGGPHPAIPKGHPEKGETPPVAGMREMIEETGVKKSDIVTVDFLGTIEGKFYLLHTYAFKLKREVTPIPDWEAVGHWYDAEDALSLIHIGHKPMLAALISAIKQ